VRTRHTKVLTGKGATVAIIRRVHVAPRWGRKQTSTRANSGAPDVRGRTVQVLQRRAVPVPAGVRRAQMVYRAVPRVEAIMASHLVPTCFTRGGQVLDFGNLFVTRGSAVDEKSGAIGSVSFGGIETDETIGKPSSRTPFFKQAAGCRNRL